MMHGREEATDSICEGNVGKAGVACTTDWLGDNREDRPSPNDWLEPKFGRDDVRSSATGLSKPKDDEKSGNVEGSEYKLEFSRCCEALLF